MPLATSGEVSILVLGGTEEKNALAGGMRDPLVLPAKYLCPRSGVSLGDLALLGESGDLRRSEREGIGRSKDVAWYPWTRRTSVGF